MNMSNWSGKKKVWVLLGIILAIIGIIVTIFLVQKQQETRSQAEKATVLSLTPPNQNVNPGEDVKLDLILNPGTNQVNFVKFTVHFDPDKFSFADVPSESAFDLNEDSGMVPTGENVVLDEENGVISRSFSVGSDPTKVIQITQTLGTITLRVKPNAASGESEVSFDETKTQVRSVGAKDPFTENVLSSTIPAAVTIGGPVCRPNVATCSWDASEGATSYHYTVAVEDSASPFVDSPILDGDTSETSVEFPSEPGKTYKCFVKASNECGESSPASGLSTCPLPSETPTPTPTPTLTLTPTPTPSPKPTSTPTPTLTPIPTKKPTAIPTETPIPTEIVVNSPTPTTEVIPTNQIAKGPTVTPRTTLPPTGNPVVYGGIIGGILFVLGGLALLLL